MKDTVNNDKRGQFKKIVELPFRYAVLKLYEKNDNLEGMYHNLIKLKPIYGKRADYYVQLANLAFRRKNWEVAVEHINVAIQLANRKSIGEYKLFKADCYLNLNEESKAADCLANYLSNNPNDEKTWKCLADIQLQLNQWEKAVNSIEKYVQLFSGDTKATFQLAECYRMLEEFENAEKYYEVSVEKEDQKNTDQSLAYTYYLLGLMQEINGKMESAQSSYSRAIQIDDELNSKHLGIGVFHETYNKLESAIKRYEELLSYKENDSELIYKLASLLNKQYDLTEAIKYYEQALEINKVNPEWHYSLASCYEQLEDYTNAAKYYKNAIDRKQNHNPEWHRRLGFVLEKVGDLNHSLKAYQEAELFRRPSSIDNAFYKKNINNLSIRYGISYEYYKIDEKTILYESMAGSRLMCNPLALFQQLMKDEQFKDYTHVWSIKNFNNIPVEYQGLANVVFVKRDTDLYMRYASSAKFIITNSKLPKNLTRKPEQKLLDTWHGTAYKTIGGHDSASPLGFKNANKVFLSTTNILTPNSHMSKIQPDSYQFKHIYAGQMAETGYPRVDSTINITPNQKQQLADELGLDLERPIVLYAPTWRGTYSNNFYDVSKLQNDFEKLSTLDVQLIFRGHHLSENHIKGKINNVKVIPSNIDSNNLLGIVDLLITDYSSIFYDFLVTDKPVIHYLYDLEEYTESRGLYFKVDELPGEIAYTIDQVLKYVKQDLDMNYLPSKSYETAKQRFCPHEDGNVSVRVIDWFIREKTDQVKLIDTGSKPSILVYGGDFTPGAKTEMFIKKLQELDHTEYNVVVIIPTSVAGAKNKMKQFYQLPKETMILPYMEGMIMTLQESKAIKYYDKHSEFANNSMKEAYDRAFNREVSRVLGESSFSYTIDYIKDSNFWSSFLNHINIKKQSVLVEDK